MSKTSKAPLVPAATVTADRAARLYRLLVLLGKGAQTRAVLTRRLNLAIRGFYRDLEVLRIIGIEIALIDGRYVLRDRLSEAINRLPFPDPGLTLADARLLAKGRSAAHLKIRRQLEQIVGKKSPW
jgi:hypothetical protein